MTFTIAQQNQSFLQKAKPWISYLILFVVLGAVAYGVSLGMHELPALKQKALLTVNASEDAQVYLNSTEIGTTPLVGEEISPKGGELKIQSASNPDLSYTTDIEPAPNTEVSIYRDLGVSGLFSSGYDLWFKKDKTNLTVISQPSGATVSIDGSEVGKTPFSLDTITEADYELKISAQGYEAIATTIKVVEGFRLNVSAQLFPIPLPGNPRVFEESGGLWDLTLNNENIASSAERARAVAYWMRTRPTAVVFGDNAEVSFEYFLDYRGNVYDSEGNLVTSEEGLLALGEKTVGGYLGFDTATPGLTAEAREAFTGVFTGVEKATVLETGTGWLRVRSLAGLSGEEVGRVNVGETYVVVEKQAGWVKIKLSDGKEGWVSADFVKVE